MRNILRPGKIWLRMRNEVKTEGSASVRQYQLSQLSKPLEDLYEKLSYYRWVLDTWGLKPKDARHLDDIRKPPFQARGIERDNVNNIKASKSYPKRFE
jgi:phenylacetate-coenzyme A ligase PaaK-like adenylate-forming protein